MFLLRERVVTIFRLLDGLWSVRTRFATSSANPRSFSFFFFSSHSFFFFSSHSLSSPFHYLSLLVATQIRGHIAGSSPLLPTTVRALHFYREKISALSSLVNSRRIVPSHARRSQQLILFILFLQVQSKSHHGGIRTHGPTLLLSLIHI